MMWGTECFAGLNNLFSFPGYFVLNFRECGGLCGGYRLWVRVVKFHIFRNGFLLVRCWRLDFLTASGRYGDRGVLLADFWKFRDFQGGGHFCSKIDKNPDFCGKNGRHFESFGDFRGPLMTFFVIVLATCSRGIGSLAFASGKLFQGVLDAFKVGILGIDPSVLT